MKGKYDNHVIIFGINFLNNIVIPINSIKKPKKVYPIIIINDPNRYNDVPINLFLLWKKNFFVLPKPIKNINPVTNNIYINS